MNECRPVPLPNYDSPSELKRLLDSCGFGMKKRFGQNFLVDGKVRSELLSFLQIRKGTKIWEIGPGLGAMTAMILEKGGELTAFEIDKGFSKLLTVFFSHKKNFKLVEGDVQKTWKNEIKEFGKPEIFFGNLPYNISLEVISAMIEQAPSFDEVLITVQKEAAERITAKPNNKNYTALSVLCSALYECKIMKIIPASAFWPKPAVESAVVLFIPKKNIFTGKDFFLFAKLVKTLFSSRRKTIKNNLNIWLHSNCREYSAEEILYKAGLHKNLRAENLFLCDFLLLYEKINSIGGCRK